VGRVTGETAAIRAVARSVRLEAERVRELAHRVDATREIAWRSRAGAAFRERVGERIAGLHRVAHAVEVAADALEHHAAACEARLSALGLGGS
jgi:uncharacterized protein YukE